MNVNASPPAKPGFDLLACPRCKGRLAWQHDKGKDPSAVCKPCDLTFPMERSVPTFFLGDAPLTIDPGKLKIKSHQDAVATIADMMAQDHGFIAHPRQFYLMYGIGLICVLGLALQIPGALGGLAAVFTMFFLDWVWFRIRRRAALSRYEASPNRLRTGPDYEAVEELFVEQGKEQPTMAEWVAAAGEASGVVDTANTAEEERYLEVRRVYRAHPGAEVVMDVGANDGSSCSQFGIGKEGLFIGLDISPQLLSKMQKNLPDQLALAGDGACLPLKDASVDFLFSTETIEHLPDPGAAIKEFGRVLKPGGRLMIQSPNALRIRNVNPFHLLTLIVGMVIPGVLQAKVVHENTWTNTISFHYDFTPQDYRRFSRDAGLSVKRIYSQGIFVPRTLLKTREAYRRKESLLGRLPMVKLLGDDLVLVAEKQ